MKDKFGWRDGSMCNEYIATSKPLLKRNASMLSGLPVEDLEPIVPKKNPKLETDKDPTVSKTDDASELWGEDEDVEQVSEQPKEVVESAEKLVVKIIMAI